MKFACPVKTSSFVTDPRILIILFYFFFLPTVSHGSEKILGGGVLIRHPSNMNKYNNIFIIIYLFLFIISMKRGIKSSHGGAKFYDWYGGGVSEFCTSTLHIAMAYG